MNLAVIRLANVSEEAELNWPKSTFPIPRNDNSTSITSLLVFLEFTLKNKVLSQRAVTPNHLQIAANQN